MLLCYYIKYNNFNYFYCGIYNFNLFILIFIKKTFKIKMLQVILGDMTFNDELEKFITEDNFRIENKKEYNTLGIIGCQSSGKSTLLNYVFGTNFEVLSDDKGRTQTTKGIWIGLNQEFKTIVFDVEGTDSKERGEDRTKFEQCSSLFTLAMCDVLMINMWTLDVGRYTANNYGVLKVIFEQNLKLFQQESAKKIVIVLRDFNKETEEISKLKEEIISDMKKIWNEIKKPDNLSSKKCEDFFKFEFITLSHKLFREEEFLKDVEAIKKRLVLIKNSNNNNCLYEHVKYSNTVPLDGFYKYAKDIWNSILENKDLNIPGQKEMLAQFKCSEAKDMILCQIQEKINKLEKESAADIIPNFKGKVDELLNLVLSDYDQAAKNYVKHVYLKIREELIKEISNRTYASFGNQIKKLIPKYQKNFKKDFEIELKKSGKFIEAAEKIKARYSAKLEDEIKEIQYFKNWESKDNSHLFEEIIENLRKIEINNNKEELKKKLQDSIEDLISSRLYSLSESFWEDLNQDLFTLIHDNIFVYKEELIAKYKITEEEFLNSAKEIETELYEETRKEMLRQLPLLPSNQIQNFKAEFWYEDSVPRTWNKIDIGKINLLFINLSEKFRKPFKIMKKFRILENILKFCEYQKRSEEEIKVIFGKISEACGCKEEEGGKCAECGELKELLSDEEIKLYLSKFEDGIKEIKEDALRRYYDVKQKVVPLWAWIILIYVSYYDIWKILKGNWLILFIVFGGSYGLLKAVGMTGLPIKIFRMVKDIAVNYLRKINGD